MSGFRHFKIRSFSFLLHSYNRNIITLNWVHFLLFVKDYAVSQNSQYFMSFSVFYDISVQIEIYVLSREWHMIAKFIPHSIPLQERYY